MHSIVQGVRLGQVGAALNLNCRAKNRPHKSSLAARSRFADAERRILIAPDNDPRFACEVEIPEHMAGRETRQQQVLWIGLGRIAT